MIFSKYNSKLLTENNDKTRNPETQEYSSSWLRKSTSDERSDSQNVHLLASTHVQKLTRLRACSVSQLIRSIYS